MKAGKVFGKEIETGDLKKFQESFTFTHATPFSGDRPLRHAATRRSVTSLRHGRTSAKHDNREQLAVQNGFPREPMRQRAFSEMSVAME